MKPRYKLVVVTIIFSLLVILFSCSHDEDKIERETELPSPEISDEIKTLIPDYISGYISDEMITLEYTEPLSDGVQLIMNTEEVSIFKYYYYEDDNYNSSHPFEIVREFGIHNGIMVYKRQTGFENYDEVYKYGYLRYNFSRIVKEEFDLAYPYINGRGVVKNSDGYGVIDTNGIFIIPCSLRFKPQIYEDIIKIPLEKEKNLSSYSCYNLFDGKYAYILKKIIDPATSTIAYYKIYENGSEEQIFDVSGIVATKMQPYKDSKTNKWGYLNEFGEVLVEPGFVYAYSFSEGYAKIIGANGKMGYLDEEGQNIIPCIYTSAGNFVNGVAKVALGSETYFITTEGKRYHNYDYLVAKNYGDGLAAVIPDGLEKWRYIDESGSLAFEGEYSAAGTFSHGFAPVTGPTLFEGEKWNGRTYKPSNYFYINKNGEPAFGPLMFEEALELNNDGHAIAIDQSWQFYVIVSKLN